MNPAHAVRFRLMMQVAADLRIRIRVLLSGSGKGAVNKKLVRRSKQAGIANIASQHRFGFQKCNNNSGHQAF